MNQDLKQLRVIRNRACVIEYERVIEFFYDPVLIIQRGEIVAANTAASRYIENICFFPLEQLLGDQLGTAVMRINKVLETKKSSELYDYRIYKEDGSWIYMETVSHYIDYNCAPAVMVCCKDITFQKFDLLNASWLQRMNMSKKRPTYNHCIIRTVYVPARTVGGDFFFFHEENDGRLIGVLGDVRGKGISAALKISAFEVLFRELVTQHSDIVSITDLLNEKILNYMDDYYIAAMLYCIDPENRSIEIIGAGIGEYFVVSPYDDITQEMLRGPFLGMFQNIGFEYRKYKFDQVKRLILYSDGIDELMANDILSPESFADANVLVLANEVAEVVENQARNLGGIRDDCSVILIDTHRNRRYKEFLLQGLGLHKVVIDEILDYLSWPEKNFDIRMILTELIINAYHYGNLRDPELPITISLLHENEHLILEVLDMGFKQKKRDIMHTIEDDDLLNENGRGLFIVRELADELIIGSKSIIVKMKR